MVYGPSAALFGSRYTMRFTLQVASASSIVRSSGVAADTTSAFTSMCATRGFSSSLRRPVIRFTTPPGRSLVASTSAKETAGRGLLSAATTTQLLPPAITGAIRSTSWSRPPSVGHITPTTPVGSYTLKLKWLVFVGFTLLNTAWYLSHQPA